MVHFQSPKSLFGYVLEGLVVDIVVCLWPFGIFYNHLVVSRPFGIFCGHLVIFSPFWYVVRTIESNMHAIMTCFGPAHVHISKELELG
jgi:hypothetical protein